MRVLPYKMGSKSARVLARALDSRCVNPDGKFMNNYDHTIINWGSRVTPTFPYTRILNQPVYVNVASDKLLSFQHFKASGISTPEWTTDQLQAVRWTRDEGITVVCRTLLRSHSGKGIVITNDPEKLVAAPLYVQYIKKQDEYRYHVFNGHVIDIQQKRKRRSVDNDEVNYQVRSSGTGWVYCRDSVVTHTGLDTMAINAVKCLGLDFGAVDIIWNDHLEQGYVLEVNTACGLEGTTIEVYTNAIRSAIRRGTNSGR